MAKKIPIVTYLLSLAQAINLSVAILSVIVSAVVGMQLAPNMALATVPYGTQFLTMMLFTYAASALMQSKGRAFVFYIACVVLFLAGIVGYFALVFADFSLQILTHILLGIYLACANFYRFAATDNLSAALKPKAVSLVVFGGLLAAFIAPLLAQTLQNVTNWVEFSLIYGAMSALAIINLVLIFIWQCLQKNKQHQAVKPSTQSREKESYIAAIFIAAVLTSAVGFLVMNLLMVQSSLMMKGMTTFSHSAQAIQWHVIAMFLPSFFTGYLITKFGVWRVMHAGFILLAVSALWGVCFNGYHHIISELVILGLAWNLSYVAGSSLLTLATPEHLKHKLQGLNDTLIALGATIGAFSPAILFRFIGWQGTHLLVFCLCLLVLFSNIYIEKKHGHRVA